MTDLTPDPDDELASAYLDDEVTADERARVEGDPVLQARVARLQAARDELVAAAIDFPSATARDATIRWDAPPPFRNPSFRMAQSSSAAIRRVHIADTRTRSATSSGPKAARSRPYH